MEDCTVNKWLEVINQQLEGIREDLKEYLDKPMAVENTDINERSAKNANTNA